MKYKGTIVVLVMSIMNGYGYADTDSDLELARKFSPILILTKDEGMPSRRVIHPEPVEIVNAKSSGALWFELRGLPEDRLMGDVESFLNWDPPIYHPNVSLGRNQFSFLSRKFEYRGRPRGLGRGTYSLEPHFNYPGDEKNEWNDIYFGTGDKAGHNFDNTGYVHIYKTTHENYADSITVVQYYYFYPYNDFENNHEGDWPHVNLVLNSRTPSSAEVLGVEYLFHGKSLSYYNNYSANPDITSDIVFNPREKIRLIQGTHPAVYVSVGGHGSYPTGGNYTFKKRGIPVPERMSNTGLVLSEQVDDSNPTISENYNLVLLPEPDSTMANMGLPDTLSWLGADVRWGDIKVPSIPKTDNDGAQGPFHSGWGKLKSFPSPEDDSYQGHENMPYTNYHHWFIIGNETWGGTTGNTISLTGDIVVFPGDTLTINPGTVIEFEPETDIHQFSPAYSGPTLTIEANTITEYEPFAPDSYRPRLVIDRTRAEIYVYGTLIAGEDTSSDSVWFRQKADENWEGEYAWGGIRIMKGGSGTFHHTEVRDTRQPESRPTNPRAEAGDGQVTLTWGDAYPEAPSITGWEYRTRVWAADLAEDAGWGSWTDVSGGADTREAVVNNLGHGEMHQFQLRAVNSTGAGPASKSVKVALMQVSYSAGTYEAVEPNPEGTTEGHPAQVTVRLTPAADRSVSIPITVTAGTAEASDYTVSGLDSGNLLDFVGGDNSKHFTLQAESDNDGPSDETLALGFGAGLPVGVRSGTPSTATVTLSESGTPGTIPPTLAAGLAASSTAAGQVRVVWDASTDMTVSGYTLRFEIGHAVARDLWAWPGTWNLCPLPALGVDSTGFTHRDLQAWRRYRYQVQATNPHGDSEWSESFPPSGVTPVPNKAAVEYVMVRPSSGESASESGGESANRGVVELVLFEPFSDPDPDLPLDSGPTFPIDFEVLVNSGGVLGAYQVRSRYMVYRSIQVHGLQFRPPLGISRRCSHALERNLSHGPTDAFHRRLPRGLLPLFRAVPSLRHQPSHRLQVGAAVCRHRRCRLDGAVA